MLLNVFFDGTTFGWRLPWGTRLCGGTEITELVTSGRSNENIFDLLSGQDFLTVRQP